MKIFFKYKAIEEFNTAQTEKKKDSLLPSHSYIALSLRFMRELKNFSG